MDLHFIERNLVNIILKIKQIFLEEKNLNSKLDIKEKSHQDYVTNFDIKIQKYYFKRLLINWNCFQYYFFKLY